jgi:hypothetical protein
MIRRLNAPGFFDLEAHSKLEKVAEAIYMSNWRPDDFENGRLSAPIWDNVSLEVRLWVLRQAEAAIEAFK